MFDQDIINEFLKRLFKYKMELDISDTTELNIFDGTEWVKLFKDERMKKWKWSAHEGLEK